MKQNRQLLDFPFRPHLAKYLFYTIKGQVIETPEAYKKNLDIDLRSPDGKMIRFLLKRSNYPVKDEPKKGYRLRVQIPKESDEYRKVVESSRYEDLYLDEQGIEIINDMYEARFRDHFHTYICGAVSAVTSEGLSRGVILKALIRFREAYHITREEYSEEALIQFYKRYDSPLKKSVYAKKKSGRPKVKKLPPPNPLINRYIKN